MSIVSTVFLICTVLFEICMKYFYCKQINKIILFIYLLKKKKKKIDNKTTKQVQLLVSDSDVESYKQIKHDLDILRQSVEKSELWVYKSKTSEELTTSKFLKRISLI